MEQERKGDPRIYIISGFFFLCVVSGGILLGLYIFLPEKFSSPYYATAGLILVGVPWFYWFLAYMYKCFSPSNRNDNIVNHVKHVNNIATTPVATSPKPEAAGPPRAKPPTSPIKDFGIGGGDDSNCGRRVHFGEVVVLGNDEEKENVNDVEKYWRMISESIEEPECNLESNEYKKDSVDDQRGIEMPLPLL